MMAVEDGKTGQVVEHRAPVAAVFSRLGLAEYTTRAGTTESPAEIDRSPTATEAEVVTALGIVAGVPNVRESELAQLGRPGFSK